MFLMVFISVSFALLLIGYPRNRFLQYIVRSKKFIDSCSYSPIMNFMEDCSLLNSLSVYSMFVLFWSHIMSISTIYFIQQFS
jgi:hypothetical protein